MWPPQIVEHILKWHVTLDPPYHLFTDPVFLHRFHIWVFTPWARPPILIFLCYSFEPSSFFFLQAVASVCFVTPTEETTCMADVLTHSQVSGPGVMGFLKMFVYKGLVSYRKSHLSHHWVPLRIWVTCHHKETPTQTNRKVNIFFPEKLRKLKFRFLRQEDYLC